MYREGDASWFLTLYKVSSKIPFYPLSIVHGEAFLSITHLLLIPVLRGIRGFVLVERLTGGLGNAFFKASVERR